MMKETRMSAEDGPRMPASQRPQVCLETIRMGGVNWFWMMIISCSAMWAFVAIVRIITDAIVRVRSEKNEIEREYLRQMMDEINEIKERLDMRQQTGPID